MDLEIIIGLEIHVQLNTKTKLFSSADNNAFGAVPNTKVNSIDMGFPGMLPVLNKTALDKSIVASIALGCKIQKFSKFDRKNYFYPDLPNGYQITQFDQPIALAGKVEIEINNEFKNIGITRVHMENDAGKLTHTKNGTLCDYNRAGTPLIEIVTDPDLRSPEEAQAFAKEVQKIVRFVDSSDADMEKGMMRFDASISLRPRGEKKFYPRTEIKNLNSFSSLQKALKYEYRRQAKLWATGNQPTGETTVGWLDDEEKTQLLRDKESAMDYRYFPEPDLPPIILTDNEISAYMAQIPELPMTRYKRYQTNLNLSAQDALKLSETPVLANFFDKAVDKSNGEIKKIAGLFLSVVLAETYWQDSKITPQHLADVVNLQKDGKISSSAAKEIVINAMKTGDSASDLMHKLGLEQKSDLEEITQWVSDVIDKNQSIVEEIKSGAKPKMIQFLMGQVMKQSKGQANPPLVLAELKKQIQ
jgi:aspartyl-tRNA(Asn)/glutamyl-tRNA(Gln) amidotransferase subunit B